MSLSLMALLVVSTVTRSTLTWQADVAKSCGSCDAWNAEQTPFRVFGNTYYVGTRGLSSILIVSDDGPILLDGALPQSAKQISAHLRSLGFELADVKLILNSHAHFDHAGGIAALQRGSDARVVASEAGARALRRGQAASDDPQAGFGSADNAYPLVAEVRTVSDREMLRLGNVTVTAHLTPGTRQAVPPGPGVRANRPGARRFCMPTVSMPCLRPDFTLPKRGVAAAPQARCEAASLASLRCPATYC